VKVLFDKKFQQIVEKIRDPTTKESVKDKIVKIVENPEIGKPMRYARKGTREVYVGSFRLSYAYHPAEELIEFLDVYHKDEQ